MPEAELKKLKGEKIVVSLRYHWMVLFIPCFLFLMGWALAIGLYFLASALPESLVMIEDVILLLAYLVLMVIHHWFFIYLFSWDLSIWVVTLKRVMGFHFLPYVRHDVEFIIISEIHEIEKKKHGLIRNILNFGEVQINLAAVPVPTEFSYVPNPGYFVNIVHTIHKSSKPESLDIEELRGL